MPRKKTKGGGTKKVCLPAAKVRRMSKAERDRVVRAKRKAAKDRLKELLSSDTFILQSHGVGKYGRCLGELFVDDVNVNKKLIEEGHAVEYHGGKR